MFSFIFVSGIFISLFLAPLLGMAQTHHVEIESQAQAPKLVELTHFQLVADAEESHFLQAAKEMEKGFLAHQTGFIQRTLVRKEGKWVDIVYWQDQDSMEAAMQKAESAPAAGSFLHMIDFSTVEMNLYEVGLHE